MIASLQAVAVCMYVHTSQTNASLSTADVQAKATISDLDVHTCMYCPHLPCLFSSLRLQVWAGRCSRLCPPCLGSQTLAVRD